MLNSVTAKAVIDHALFLGADFAELFVEHHQTNTVQIASGEVEFRYRFWYRYSPLLRSQSALRLHQQHGRNRTKTRDITACSERQA